ncbi:MAG: hypothetical protein Q8J66_09075 [Methylotenera sp.]|nr:hypothetical protein [Methylotenera sp.]
MKRIDTSTRAVDLHGAGKDGYKDGNKALGIPATDLNASTLNALQEEIANVIEGDGTGTALNPADNTQLLQAITNIAKGPADKIVRVASTAAINLAAPGANIDGTVMVAGDTFLEKDNATLADRGIYVWNGSAVPATRDPGADTGAELFGGMIIRVKEGTANADTNWQITNDGVVTIGVTGLTFKLVGASKAISAIQGAFRNLKGSATGTNAVVTYTIDEIITGDGAGEYLTTRNWNGTITMTLAGAGGLDQGAVAASTWYYAFSITKDDGTKAYIASLSSASPTLPVGYTKWARVGAMITDGTANKYPLSFIQYGRKVRYKVAPATNVTAYPLAASGAAGTISNTTFTPVAVSLSSFVPPSAGIVILNAATYSTSNYCGVAPSSSGWAGWDTLTPPPIISQDVATNFSNDMALESTSVYWASMATTGVLRVLGWEDNI